MLGVGPKGLGTPADGLAVAMPSMLWVTGLVQAQWQYQPHQDRAAAKISYSVNIEIVDNPELLPTPQ